MEGVYTSRSISRVLSNGHSSATNVTVRLKRPTRIRRGSRHKDPYLVLLRAGFTIATVVTNRAVRSYRTFSPLLDLHRGGFPSLHFP